MSYLPEVREGIILQPRHIRRISNQKLYVKLAPEKKKKRFIKKLRRINTNAQVPKKYREYIKSPWWVLRKASYYKIYGRKCAVCATIKSIDLHHMVYGDLGSEKDEHLVALCREHHDAFHEKVGVKRDMLKETYAFIDHERQMLEFPKFN